MQEFNYSLDQLSYTEDQTKKILSFNQWLKNQSIKFGNIDLFTKFKVEFLESLSLQALQELVQYKTVLLHLEDIHFKTMRTVEYKNIQTIIKLVPEKIDSLTEQIPYLEESLKSKYSQAASSSEIFQKLYTYQEFKDQFNSLFNSQIITINQINEYKKQDIFEICRQNIMKNKVELETSFQEGAIIKLEDLKLYPRLYQLIASEFFYQYTKESLEINQFSGNHLVCELIRPSHGLSEKFHLAMYESALLTVSLNPIVDPGLKPQDLLSYFDLMFEITDCGESYKLDIFWPLKLSSKTYYIEGAVYFNHYRLQLISGQRSANWRKHG